MGGYLGEAGRGGCVSSSEDLAAGLGHRQGRTPPVLGYRHPVDHATRHQAIYQGGDRRAGDGQVRGELGCPGRAVGDQRQDPVLGKGQPSIGDRHFYLAREPRDYAPRGRRDRRLPGWRLGIWFGKHMVSGAKLSAVERRGQDTGAAGPGGASWSGNLRWLYVGRALRSFTTAFLTVVFPLYLAQAGYGSVAIGAMLTGSVVTTAALVVGVGLLADRIGPRPVLVSLGLVGAVGAGVVAMTTNPVALMLASGLGGVGRGGGAGSGGAFGPFFPAEQSMLASSSPLGKRTTIFGYVGFVGVLAAAAGSLVALVPAVAHGDGLSWIAAYRVVFWLGAALSVVVTLASLRLRAGTFAPLAMPADRPGSSSSRAEGSRQGKQQPGADRQGPVRPSVRQRDTHRLSTRQLIGRLGLTNALNGLGIGFIGPLLTYWFHVRYGAGPGEIGTVYMVVNLASAIPYLGAARVTRRLGPVRTVVVTRGASTAFLLAMAWMPTFPLAGLLYAVRMIVNSLGMPARQSYVMGVADERRRGTVAAMGTLPAQLFGTITPVVGGALMVSAIDAPIFGAAFFMTANVIAYYFAFRHVGAGPPRQAPGVARLAAGESADG